MKRKIITDEEKLSERSFEVDIKQKREELVNVADNLKQLITKNGYTALSAKQIGCEYRMFCINFNGDIRTFINPMITKSKGLHLSRECNASFGDREFVIPRNDEIITVYQTLEGKVEHNSFSGPACEIFQQQVNLLDGVLLPMLGLEIEDDFRNATPEEQQQVLDLYIKSLENTNKELQTEVESNEQLKQMSNGIKFMTGVATGEVTVLPPQPNREQRRLLDKQAKRLDALLRAQKRRKGEKV